MSDVIKLPLSVAVELCEQIGNDLPTLEMDAAERMAYSQEYMVDTEFARKLERERDDALSQIVQAECRAERFCQERDEARNDILGWENKWKYAVDMAARAEIERDEAINKLNDLKNILQ